MKTKFDCRKKLRIKMIKVEITHEIEIDLKKNSKIVINVEKRKRIKN